MSEHYDIYAGKPPHVDTATSLAAAKGIAPQISTLRERVYRYIAACGALGATDDQVEAALKMRHQTASARRRELVIAGRVVDSGRTAKTRSGARATVWVVTSP